VRDRDTERETHTHTHPAILQGIFIGGAIPHYCEREKERERERERDPGVFALRSLSWIARCRRM
jgi:hypothetical protein